MVQHLQTRGVVNEDFDPDDRQEAILRLLKSGRDDGLPWGYATVKRCHEETDIEKKQYVNRAMDGLVDAGWVEKPYRGLYRFVSDPREEDDE